MLLLVAAQEQEGRFRQMISRGNIREAEEGIFHCFREIPLLDHLRAFPVIELPGKLVGSPVLRFPAVAAAMGGSGVSFLQFDLVDGLRPGPVDPRTGRQAFVESDREVGGHLVVDLLRGAYHRRHPGLYQVQRLLLGAAAVDEDHLQALLAGQEGDQAFAVGHGVLPAQGFQQELVTVGMAAVVENCDAVAVFLEHIENIFHRGVGPFHHLAESGLAGFLQRLADAVHLDRQVPQVGGVVDPVIGKCQENDRLVGRLASG